MEESRKKTTVFVLVASILIVSLGVAYAYWSAIIQGEGSPMTFEAVNDLKITYTEGTDVTGSDTIKPGWKYSKTFTVENESSGPFKFDIVIKNLVNTFVTDFLKYKITSTDGYNMTDYKMIPKSATPTDTVLAYSVEISGTATQHYTIEFYYEDSTEVDQNDDIGKKFGGTLGIIEETNDPHLFSILTNGKKYTIDSTRNTNTDTPIEGETIQQEPTSTGLIYMTNKASETEDGSTTNPIYYFAGNPSDNWVKFAGFYWRIIRTDKDHGVKLLYAGTTHNGQDGYINATETRWGTTDADQNAIKYENALFKSDLESWYNTNIGIKYENLISTTAKYCNDTSYTTDVSNSENKIEYGSYTRLNIFNNHTPTPTYKCPNENDSLQIKVGLMTGDEISFAGGVYGKKAPNTYYYRNSIQSKCTGANGDICSVTNTTTSWSLSPHVVNSLLSNVYAMRMGGSKQSSLFGCNLITTSNVIRPVITLSSEAEVKSGTGIATDPYTIVGTED